MKNKILRVIALTAALFTGLAVPGTGQTTAGAVVTPDTPAIVTVPWRVPGQCTMPVREVVTGAESGIAKGDTGKALAFNDFAYKLGFGAFTWPETYFGFKDQGQNGSFAKGLRRTIQALDKCGVVYRRITFHCDECSFLTGDEVGGNLAVTGLDVSITVEKRSGGWSRVCDAENDRFRIDYFGFSDRTTGGNSGLRPSFSVHDGAVYLKISSTVEVRHGDIHCPIYLNIGTQVELDYFAPGPDLNWAIFRVRNDGRSSALSTDVADWLAFWARLW